MVSRQKLIYANINDWCSEHTQIVGEGVFPLRDLGSKPSEMMFELNMKAMV